MSAAQSEAQKKRFENSYKSGHLDRYTCEFDFIANILPELFTKGEIDNYVMTHPTEWRNILLKKKILSDFGIDEISVKTEEKDGEIRFIYIFPEPKVAPNCYYSILVIDKKKEWSYFTLEKDNNIFPSVDILIDSLALVCGQKGYKHIFYSRWCNNYDLDEFKMHVQEILDNKPYDRYKEGVKFLDPSKIAKKLVEMDLENDNYNDDCSIF